MIRTDFTAIRQDINMGQVRIEGIVIDDGQEFYILTDMEKQTTDHCLVGEDALFDSYVEMFNL